MITLQKMGNGFNRNVLEIVGLSSDTKPLNSTGGIEGQQIANGSTIFCMDTSAVFMFDATGDQWYEL
jgi:hypothetical protein